MSGKKIAFLPGGYMVAGYVKLIPSAHRRKTDYPRWNCVTVDRKPFSYAKETAEIIQSRIRDGVFTERFFIGNTQLPALSENAKKNGFILFPQDWMDMLFPNQVPSADPGGISLSATAAKGEFEPATFGLHALEDRDFVLTGGEEFRKHGIIPEITVVRSMYKRLTYFYQPSEIIFEPVWLEKTAAFTLKKNTSGQYWITFRIPEKIEAGVYRDAFILSANGKRTVIPATVRVLPFSLVENDRFAGFFPGPNAFTGAEDLVREMSEHGMNAFILDASREIRLADDGKGGVNVDFGSCGVVDEMKKQGMKALIIRSGSIAARSGRDKALYQRIIRSIHDEAARRGWPKPYFYTEDEILSHPKLIPGSIWELQTLREMGAKSWCTHIWYKTSRNLQKEVDAMAPNIYAFALRFNNRNLWYVDDWASIQARCAKEGRELWSYNIDNALSSTQTAAYRFSLGWFFRTLGKETRGQMFWAYNCFHGSPYNDLDKNSTDWVFSFPARPGRKGGYAINYEAMREGVDDMRYILTLEDRIARAKTAGVDVSRAENLLKRLSGSFDFGENFRKNSVFLDGKFDRHYEKDGQRRGEGQFNIPIGWKFRDYHAARAEIAAEIVRLDEMLRRK